MKISPVCKEGLKISAQMKVKKPDILLDYFIT